MLELIPKDISEFKNTHNDIKDLYIDIYNNVYDFCRNSTKNKIF